VRTRDTTNQTQTMISSRTRRRGCCTTSHRPTRTCGATTASDRRAQAPYLPGRCTQRQPFKQQ
jgi:hypothetical protein